MCKPQGEAVSAVQEDLLTAVEGIDLPWHALYTRHQHEKTVARILEGKGHLVFLPLYCTVHRWQDRMKQLWLPLFLCIFPRKA